MSASLVGSEMCIRDSPRGPSGSYFESLALPGGLRPPRTPPASREATAPGPVSYTHLTLPTICSV
eukprot:2739336-Alexandrium_andersonii.AAC.1